MFTYLVIHDCYQCGSERKVFKSIKKFFFKRQEVIWLSDTILYVCVCVFDDELCNIIFLIPSVSFVRGKSSDELVNTKKYLFFAPFHRPLT